MEIALIFRIGVLKGVDKYLPEILEEEYKKSDKFMETLKILREKNFEYKIN